MNILVTAANGNLGAEIVNQLAQEHSVIAGVRNLENTKSTQSIEFAHLDYDKPDTYSALQGVDAIVLQAPPLDSDAFQRLTPFIQAIAEAGIKRVVFVSAFGVNHNDAAPLRKIELALIEGNFEYTFVRPNFFLENFTSGFAVGPLQHDGIVLSSAGEGKLAFVSIKDIAAVIVQALSSSGHEKAEYNLTGSEALSHQDIADKITDKLGKKVPHVALSSAELKAGAMENGMPESAADYLIKLYDLAEQGLLSHVTDDIEKILGKAPITFDQVFTG